VSRYIFGRGKDAEAFLRDVPLLQLPTLEEAKLAQQNTPPYVMVGPGS